MHLKKLKNLRMELNSTPTEPPINKEILNDTISKMKGKSIYDIN